MTFWLRSSFAEDDMPDDDDDELSASLLGLSGLLGGHRPLEDSLVKVAGFAVHAIPEAEGAGLTVLEEDRQQTVVAMIEFVR